MANIEELLQKNATWSSRIKEEDPDFFKQLAEGQNPDILWIGCSDSRVPANQIVDLPPGELFVHRNIANVVVHTDLNCLSVVQYAVEVLEVDHIVVCGHYGCGGVKAAMDDQDHGLIDNWLRHIKDVNRLNAERLEGLSHDEKINLLCELNVKEQVINVSSTTIVQNAWKQGADLSVHGLIYGLEDGQLKNLDMSVRSVAELEEKYS
ncbi:carbonate dehydratase [Fodinibius salsisoli]|uniref:Carbonic anhydrase n=1 Tax=Fodinibius salsisoli TaxID=2820877 RepID=A0ABT3PN05_9BACT|nr:carbonate dehydratase [Fodinibius salsisoli]